MNYTVQAGKADKWAMPHRLIRLRFGTVLTMLFLLIIGIPFTSSWCAEPDKLFIDLDTAKLNINFGLDAKFKNVTFGGKFFMGTYPAKDWEVEQYTPTQYRVRHKSWKDIFWNIDCEQKKISRMKGTDLKAPGMEPKLLTDISLDVQKKEWSGNGPLLSFGTATQKALYGGQSQTVQQGDTKAFHMMSISLSLESSHLVLDQQAAAVHVLGGGAVISDADAWEVRRVSKDIYHFRFKQRPHDFWQIDLASMSAAQVTGGNFGFPGGRAVTLSESVSLEGSYDSQAKSEIPIDVGMARYRGNHPKSAWQESEKALNEAVLTRNSYDVLIVPFQVGGYAIDRVDRSLMTRYLIREIEISTKMKLPSPTLVMRTLGDASRTFNDFDVFQLANKLGVKQIVRGYVGHDLNEKMSVTLVVQTREGQEYFSPSTKTVKYSWNDIAISDEHTPGEAFLSILHDVSERLQLPKTKKSNINITMKEGPPSLPAGIKGLVVNSSSSPIARAYYLQLLGMLYPEQSVAKEEMFERSLVVLRELSPQSPAYNVLKARALFHLYRRPAALAVLGAPKSIEGKALSAVMDGNLQSLDKSIKDIKETLPRLITQIERSDLLWKYSYDHARSESIDRIVRQWPGCEKVLARRLNHHDGWNLQSNIEIKKELDQLFPISGFTSENIVKGKMVLGEFPMDDDDIEFSVYNHYRRMMENQYEKLSMNESTGIVDRDILDLMVSVGESNLIKNIRLRLMQGLYDEMIKRADRYGVIYGGQPEMTFLKAFSLFRTADSRQGQAQKNLREEASQLQRNVCYWSQGQTEVASQRSCVGRNYYDADYPRRPYWSFSRDPKDLTDRKYRGGQEFVQRGNLTITPHDRKEMMNLELSLLYTQADFSTMSTYYEKLKTLQMGDEAATLLKKNGQRFIGNSSRTSFFASIAEKEGDVEHARTLYEEAAALQPNDWSPYDGLSSLLIRQGDFKTALKTALKYPLFSVLKDKRENAAIDTVALSNHAFHIGRNLWWRGAAEEAKPLLQLSAGYDTGSAAEMLSTTFLALLDHDFEKAARMSLANAKRYNLSEAYGNYMELLHVMGYHDEAWSVLPQILGVRRGVINWSPVLIGLRVEGKTTNDQMQWLKNQSATTPTSQDAAAFAFLVYTLDRNPDKNLAEKLKSLQERGTLNVVSKASAHQKPDQLPPNPSLPQEFLKRYADPMEAFSDGYVLLKKHQFSDANGKLKERFSGEWIRKDMFSFAIPYLAWSATKDGEVAAVESYLHDYRNKLGADFDYYLSQAFLSEGKKDHSTAIKNLELALYHTEQLNGMRLFPAIYQLAETCEWLYEDSKFEGYRDLLLKFIRIRQTNRPMDSWAYAFEAKYAKSDSERIKALGITLYLDKQSERITHFSESEKNKAFEWMKKNNPFLQSRQKASKQEI